MKIDSAMLKEIAAMPAEAMAVAIRFLAVQLETEEKRLRATYLRGAKAGPGTNEMTVLRNAVYDRDGYSCVYCGSEENLTCDHVVPVSKGGDTTLENLVTACKPCNSRKRDRERKQFERSLEIPGTKLGQPSDKGGKFHPLARVLDSSLNSKQLERKEVIPPIPPTPQNQPSPDTRVTFPDGFEDFWEAYPPRAGNRDKLAAVRAYRAALKRATPREIIDGAKRYRLYTAETGKSRTEFVRQARTWLNGNGWQESYELPKKEQLNGKPPTQSQLYGAALDNIARAVTARTSGETG